MVYRQREGKDTWHFCKNCSNWPKKKPYVERKTKPTKGDLCNQCRAKKKRKECKA